MVASLFSHGRFIVGSSCNASYNAFTSGFISAAIRNQNGDSELTSIGQGDKSYVVGGGGDPAMSPGTASPGREEYLQEVRRVAGWGR